MLDAHQRVSSVADANQFVELHLHGCAVAVLRILDEKDHVKGDDRGAGVDDKLPGIRKAEERSGHAPDDNDRGGHRKSRGAAGGLSRPAREMAKELGGVALLFLFWLAWAHDYLAGLNGTYLPRFQP